MSQITIPVVMVTFFWSAVETANSECLRMRIVIQRRLFSPESLSFGIIFHLILI